VSRFCWVWPAAAVCAWMLAKWGVVARAWARSRGVLSCVGVGYVVGRGGEEGVLAFAFDDEILERTGWSERHARLSVV
jgi:hypothetical protein